jgi:hypothetical protein
MVARLTPDQKVACSSHVEVSLEFYYQYQLGSFSKIYLPGVGIEPTSHYLRPDLKSGALTTRPTWLH